MKSQKFNLFLKIYLVILFFFAIFFFFQKYNNNVEWTISEWLINYQGGFTRRGLIGEIVFQFSTFFYINFRETILLFQILTCALYFYLVYNFLKKTNKNLILVFAILSPLFLTYPIAEVEVLGRKEIFVFISFILIANIFSKKVISIKDYFYTSILLCLTCLIWEGIAVYLSFFLFIFILKNGLSFQKRLFFNLILCFFPFLITFYLLVIFRLSGEELKVMCNSINECYGAMTYLNRDLASNIGEVKSKFQLSYLIRYILIFLVGFFPLILLIINSKFNSNSKYKNKYYFSILFTLIFIPSLSFYYIAQDWGRWINISYTLSLLTYIFCIKNNIISTSDKKLNFSFFKNKIITYLLIILFCFSWSPKTLMNDDVGSIPIYRKSLIIINNLF